MAIRSVSDLVYVVLARLPLLALLVAVVWILATGVAGLERVSWGTEYFVGNDETANVLPQPGGPSDEDILMDALNSGDVSQMSAALDQVEARQQRLAR